jgi:hypothetical protein
MLSLRAAEGGEAISLSQIKEIASAQKARLAMTA